MNHFLIQALRYSSWATQTLIARCRDLTSEQLTQPARGYGSILATLDHLVTSDAHYVTTLSGTPPEGGAKIPPAETLEEIAARVEETLERWEQFLAEPFDTERLLTLDQGAYECHASVVAVQALHHGSAHREQVRAALKELGVEPPDLQPWEGALELGRARWTKDRS